MSPILLLLLAWRYVLPRKKLMNKILLLLISFCLAFQANAEDVVYETEWMPSVELEYVLGEMNGNRLYPCYVEGRLNGIAIQYKGSFCPFPQGMNIYESRWGMSDDWYKAFKTEFESVGFIEHSHSLFTDLSGSQVHQATWVLNGQ
jgi:hypothetical protein